MSKPISSSVTSVKTNLRQPVDFVGREMELEEVLDGLGPSTRAWIISLTGVGGIGKTELAIKAAHIAVQRKLFSSIIWTTAKDSWLTHEGIRYLKTQLSVDDLLDTIIKVLELDPRLYKASPERKKEQVEEILRSTSCLLIVDNLETIQDQAVIEFLMELPNPSKALVTSRFGGLKAPGVAVAQTLEGQREVRVGPLSQEDAINLFLRKASDQGLRFSREEHIADLKVVVSKAGYIPLAIEWIIGQMALKHDNLDAALERLESSNGEVLKYCFDNLIASVGSRAQKVLLAISIFEDSVSEEILREVTNMQAKNQAEELERLTAASLIEKLGERYSILAPTRLYVNSLRRDFAELYREYCITASENYVRLLSNLGQEQQWHSLENEQHNILSLFSWCFDNRKLNLALDLAHALSEYLHRRGLWDQRAYVCDLATEAATNLGNRREAVRFTYDAAEIHKARGRLDEALEEFQRCEEYSREIGDREKAAHAHMQQGIILYHKDRHTDSIRVLRQSLEMHKSNGDRQGVAQNLTLLGRNELKIENLEIAQQHFEESLSLKEQIGDQLAIAISQYDLGHLHHRLGNLQIAEHLFKEALKVVDSPDEKRHQANAKWYYALLQIDRDNLDAARSLLTDVLFIEEALQRDKRFERASTKLVEVEEAIKARGDAQGTGKLRAVSLSQTLRPADLAAKVMTMLIPFVSTEAEEFAGNIGSAAYEKAKSLFSILEKEWSGDTEAMENLKRFEEKPERYKPVLEDILQEKLSENKDLVTELSRLL